MTEGDEPDDVPDQMALLEGHYGTKAAAARAAGVSRETWRRWGLPAGRHLAQRPSAAKLAPFVAAVARVRVSDAAAARVAAGDFTVSGTVTVSSDTRHRDRMNIGREIARGQAATGGTDYLGRVTDQARAGNWTGAAGTLTTAANMHYVNGMRFETMPGSPSDDMEIG
jgi:hypothetical protein